MSNSLPGLQDRYYDARMGILPTVERIHYARFSVPYAQSLTSYIYTKKDEEFDFEKITDKKIGKYPI